jgi:site-specific recombinase XerD
MTVSEAQTQFLLYLANRKNRSPGTITTYDKVLNDFVSVIGDKSIKDVTIEDVDRYADVLYARGNAVKTRRNRLATVRSLLRYLYIKEITDIRPEKVELPVITRKEAVFLTTEEAQRLISVITDKRDRALILTLLSTWVRINECLNIRVEDINHGSIIIRAGKGGSPRVVFLNQETKDAIKNYTNKRGIKSGFLFLNYNGEQLHRRYVGRMLSKYAASANITKNVTNHTLRHTGATQFLNAGGRVEDAQQILGHSDISTTMIYLHFTNDRLRRTYVAHTPSFKYTYPQTRTVHKQKHLANYKKVQ